MQQAVFATNCIAANGDDIAALRETARACSLSTIRRQCQGFQAWTREVGYDRWLPISKDWHVAYYRGVYRGLRCYFVVWSGIEWIWVVPEQEG